MIYEAKYNNGERTVLTDFSVVIRFIRDTKVGATVIVWDNGNAIMQFEIKDQA